MKFAGYLTEATVSKEEIKKILNRDCAKFLKEMRGEYDLLFRGSYKKVNRIAKIKHNKERKPKDTPQELHDLLNKKFKKKFGWPVRNGIFTTSSYIMADGYGIPYKFFPIGDYKYVYSTKIEDLFQYFEDRDITIFFSDDNKYDNNYIYNEYVDKMSDMIFNHIENNNGKGMKFKTDDGRSIINIGKYIDYLDEKDMELDIDPEYNDNDKWFFNIYDSLHSKSKKVKKIYLVDWDKPISFEEYKEKSFPEIRGEKAEDVIEGAIKTYKDTGLYKQVVTPSNYEITFWCDYYYLVDYNIYLSL